jgi:two-component system response regulator
MARQFILLVEDNSADEELTRRALGKSGAAFDVVAMHDGAEALDFLHCTGEHAGRDGSQMPRVVLLDLQLPRLNGFELLERLRADERTRLLPIVILSSSDEAKDVSQSYAMGANSYVRKPVDFSTFNESMQQLCHYWLSLNHPPPPPPH